MKIQEDTVEREIRKCVTLTSGQLTMTRSRSVGCRTGMSAKWFGKHSSDPSSDIAS